jgi:hypothetical protein
MSLVDKKALAIKNFNKLGVSNGTSPPESSDNRFTIAYEYFIADALASVAAKRKDIAKAAALEAGVLGDREEQKEGNSYNVFSSDDLFIVARVATAVKTLDKTKLMSELVKLVGVEKTAAIIEACSKSNKPAVTYIVST